MKLFIATTLLCVVMGYALPTQKLPPTLPPYCADPSYACQDLKTARSCGVVKSCIYDVWSTMSAPDDDNEVCDICKEMVKEARDQLLSNMTQEEIKEVFEGSCKLLPIQLVANACIKIVDDIIPELIEMLASRMDPNMVCTVSGLCNVDYPLPTDKVAVLSKSVTVQDNLTCEFCESLVEHVKTIFNSTTTKEEFKTALLNFCHQLGGFEDECSKLVNDDYDKIYDFLMNKMDPHDCCMLLGLCDKLATKPLLKISPARPSKIIPLMKVIAVNSFSQVLPLTKTFEAKRIDVVPNVKISPGEINTKKDKYNLYKKVSIESNNIFGERFGHPSILLKKDTECAFCKAMMFFLKNDLKTDRSEATVKRTLDSICTKWLSGYSDYCHSFLKQNYVALEKNLAHNVDFIEICGKMNICPLEENGKEIAVKVMPPKVNSFIDCEICKKFISLLRSHFEEPETKAEIEKIVDKVCSLLPQEFQPKCLDFIHTNLDFLVNIILQELDPDTVCKAFAYCSVRRNETKDNITLKGIECDLCKDSVHAFAEELEDPDVQDYLKSSLEKVCSILPNEFTEKCQDFVDENFDELIRYLADMLDPDEICNDLGLCPGSKLSTAPKFTLKPKPKEDTLKCELCKSVMKFVQEDLEQQKTEEAIVNALNKACSYLPKSWSIKCEKFNQDYTEIIVSMISQGMDPSLVCSSLDVCSAGSFECPACEDFFHFLQGKLYDNDTQEGIKNVLKRVCTLFPTSLQGNCEAFINEYGSSFLVLLAQKLDPNTVCVAFKLCPGSSNFTQTKPKHTEIKQLNLEPCDICQTIVDYLDKLLENDDVDKDITHLIEKVCTVVPTSYRGKCVDIIEAYGPYLLQMIGQLANSKQVCQEIGLCARPPGQVHLLGGPKCAIGPSYWCLTKAHAAACKAQEFCKQNNWKHITG